MRSELRRTGASAWTIALASAALALGSGQDDGGLWDIDSVPVNLAKEAYDAAVREAREPLAVDLARARDEWDALDRGFEEARSGARERLEAGLEEALQETSRRGEVDETLLLERALQAIEADEEIPVDEAGGRPGRGAAAWGGHHYKLFDGLASWTDARATCRAAGGRLAVLETEEERLFAAGLLTREWAWVGGSDAAEEGRWFWLTGAPVEGGWEPGQPDDWGRWEHGLLLHRGGVLADGHDGDTFQFLCEWGSSPREPWSFTWRSARKAKDAYDAAMLDADRDRAVAREKIEGGLRKPRATFTKSVERAERALLGELEDALEREVRAGRSAVGLGIRAAQDAVERGECRPRIDPLGGGAAPEDAVSCGGRRFLVFGERVPWGEARERCEALGGRLAVCTSDEVRELLVQFAGEHGHLWIGGSDAAEEGEWRWLDGRPVSAGWAPDEPNDDRGWQEHLLATTIGWDDEHDQIRFPFVCEWGR